MRTGKITRIFRCCLADVLYARSSDALKRTINKDVYRYLKWYPSMANQSTIERLNWCLYHSQEFRNVFYYRQKRGGFLKWLSTKFLPPLATVEIGPGEIDEGFFISHHHAIVFPQQAGKNLRIGPGVVIGRKGDKYPTIGDNVYICANSVVIGGVHIGDNVIIGAGSVVTKDIPSDSVYAGNPARFIKTLDRSSELWDEIM